MRVIPAARFPINYERGIIIKRPGARREDAPAALHEIVHELHYPLGVYRYVARTDDGRYWLIY